MSESVKVDGDSAEVSGNGEAKEQRVTPSPESASPEEKSNNLSSQLEEKIIRQVEYYFGDRNLPRDKFLQSAAAENDGGWISIATLLTFNRLKALSSDPAVIVRSLRKSTGDVLEVNSEGSSVRRSPDNPPPDIFSAEQRQRMKAKTVYVKGFHVDTGLDEIQSFFDQFGELEHVQMRRNLADRTFKGSVFAEFKEKKMAETFLGLSSVQFKDTELIKESKEAYYTRKGVEKKDAKKTVEPVADAPISRVLTKGAVVHFKGAELNTSREDIKEQMQAYATVAFIDYARGDKEGFIRFEEEGSASKVVEGLKEAAGEDEATKMCGAEVDIRILEGTEEEEHWVKLSEHRLKSKRGGRRGGGRGGGRAGGRSYGDRKRKYRSDDAPARKHQKQDGEEGDGEKVGQKADADGGRTPDKPKEAAKSVEA